jgi:hypothetical protein
MFCFLLTNSNKFYQSDGNIYLFKHSIPRLTVHSCQLALVIAP